VPFTLNLAGLVFNLFTGKWIIGDLYVRSYYVLLAVIVIATALDFTPRARRSTRNEGAEKAWFYVAVWTVVPTQIAAWAMWRLGSHFDLSPRALGNARLLTFLLVAAAFFSLSFLGKLPRTQRYFLPSETELAADEPEFAGE